VTIKRRPAADVHAILLPATGILVRDVGDGQVRSRIRRGVAGSVGICRAGMSAMSLAGGPLTRLPYVLPGGREPSGAGVKAGAKDHDGIDVGRRIRIGACGKRVRSGDSGCVPRRCRTSWRSTAGGCLNRPAITASRRTPTTPGPRRPDRVRRAGCTAAESNRGRG
jgi:hypothetical protein